MATTKQPTSIFRVVQPSELDIAAVAAAEAKHAARHGAPRDRPTTTLEQFTETHGEHIDVDNQRLFANGARVSSINSDLGMFGGRGFSTFFPPPEDTYERLQAQATYLRTAINQEQRKFDEFRQHCIDQANMHVKYGGSCPPPPADAEQQLHRGLLRIQTLEQRMMALQEQIDATPEVQQAKANQRHDDAEMRAVMDQRARIGDLRY